jgi:hypothetical protein
VGILVEKDEDRSELSRRINADLRERAVRSSKQEDVDLVEDSEYLKTFAMIAMLSYDIYAKKQLIERLIDSVKDDEISKEKLKEAKENAKRKEKSAREMARQHEKAIRGMKIN